MTLNSNEEIVHAEDGGSTIPHDDGTVTYSCPEGGPDGTPCKCRVVPGREFLPCDAEDYDDPMDGDHASALASAGWGTDEDYGCAEEIF